VRGMDAQEHGQAEPDGGAELGACGLQGSVRGCAGSEAG
jgi:hypothetical protein